MPYRALFYPLVSGLYLFKSEKKTEDAFSSHAFDKTGNSIANGLYIETETGDQIGVECYIWGKEIQNEKNWKDNLKVNITTKKIRINR